MPAGKKLVVAASVIATGAGAALFFRKDASEVARWNEAFYDSAFRERVERRVEDDVSWAKTTASRGRESAVPGTPAYRVPPAETAAISEAPRDSGAPTFQKSLNPVGALLAPPQSVPIDEPVPDEPSSNAIGGDRFVESARQFHRIRDGDTLTRLAERYLGRADRYLEIFELNRDVLASPNLLPIGAVLKIPPRGGSSSGVTSRDWPTDESPVEPPTDLVPVEQHDASPDQPA